MTFNYTVQESPWVTLKMGDPSFQLQGPFTLANRASIEITKNCPKHIATDVVLAIQAGWIRAVATVPKDDPTYMWETLKR
ncbi:hypothetical protein UFOVP112_75 [uncultured Caudovirales phage]|uniref:Uncharacterized protein n=1 Tax=uncultured Caudovirales phage TaxID=2100421 RepID=A0A6J5L357_9CAUD|nr:hypothetical protein UFOVP112_75 [uncultured Caudovirales phage]